jgi:hypothetical protein
MAGELVHRLQAELDGAEADGCRPLLDGGVELSQRQHRLPIGLLVEGDRHSKARWVIVDIGAMVQDQPFAGNDLEVVEAAVEQGAVPGDHVEARPAAGAHVHLPDGAGEPVGAEPLAEGIGIGPRREHRVAGSVENSNEDDLTVESPRRRVGDGRGAAHGFSNVGGGAVRSDVRRR